MSATGVLEQPAPGPPGGVPVLDEVPVDAAAVKAVDAAAVKAVDVPWTPPSWVFCLYHLNGVLPHCAQPHG